MAMMVVTLSFGAHAQGDGAAREFEKGMEFFRRGAHDEAARSFYAAYRASPHPDSLYNAGLAWELAGELAKAATAFEISLGLTLRQKAREDATRRLRSLARELGRVEVSVPEGSTLRVLGFVIRSPSSVVYLEPGKQRLGVTLPDGSSADRRVVAEAGATTVVLVELPREDSASSSAAPQEPLPQPPRAESQSSTTETIGWVSLGVAAAASVAAVVLGIEALRARDDYEGSRNTDRDARRKAEDLRLWTNVAWGTAALTGGGGAVILLTLPPKDAQAGLPVSGVAVRGRF
jgi:hypothetical protein